MRTLIQQGNPLSDFVEACSMLDLERRTREENEPTGASPPTVLVAAAPPSPSYTINNNHGSGGNRHTGANSGGGKGKGKGKKNWHNNGSGKNNANNGHGQQGQPQPMQQFSGQWFGPWGPYFPPCPYPSMPAQWRGQQPHQHFSGQGVLGPAPRQPNTAFIVPGSAYQPTDFPVFFNL